MGTVDAYKTSLELCRNGILVGPSSGFTFKGLINYLEKNKNIKNKNCIFICCDGPLIYLDEYFKYFKNSNFPKIGNKKLFNIDKTTTENSARIYSKNKLKISIKPKKMLSLIYNTNDFFSLKKDILLYDIRNKNEFKKYSLFNSQNINYLKLQNLNFDKNKKIYIICEYGEASFFF